MENKDSSQLNDNQNLKKNIKPLEDIVKNNLSQFKNEDIIHIFFSLKNQNILIDNKNFDFPEALKYIKNNTKVQLKIFLEVLSENYENDNIISELYKKIFIGNNDNSYLQQKYINKINKEKHSEKRKERHINNNNDNQNNYINFPKKIKRKREKSIVHNNIKIKNNWIIPLKSSFSGMGISLNEEEDISKNIIGYLYKNKSNHIFIYYPIFEQNIFTNDNMNKIIEDKKKILFVCELFINERIKDRCNSYGIYNLETMNFSMGGRHSKSIEEHENSRKVQLNDYYNQYNKDNELFDIISQFSTMKIRGALIIKEKDLKIQSI